AVPWAEVVATPPKVRGGEGTEMEFGYAVTIGNSGGEEALVVAVIDLPEGPVISPNGDRRPIPKDDIEDSISTDPLAPLDPDQHHGVFANIPKKIDRPDGTSFIPFVLDLPPGGSVTLHGGFDALCPGRFNSDPKPKARVVGFRLNMSRECMAKLL